MGYILYNENGGGWYGGPNKKYAGMFDLTSDKYCAKIFQEQDECIPIMNRLNGIDWKFVIQEAPRRTKSGLYEETVETIETLLRESIKAENNAPNYIKHNLYTRALIDFQKNCVEEK